MTASRGVALLPVWSALRIAVSGRQKIVVVLGVEHGDEAVARRHGDKREEPRAIDQLELLCGCDLPHDRIPGLRTGDEPEAADLGLLGGTLGAATAAQFADLIQIVGPGLRVERGRRRGAELRAPVHHPRRHAADRRAERNDGRHVDAGLRVTGDSSPAQVMPSLARSARISAPACLPSSMPLVLASPSGIGGERRLQRRRRDRLAGRDARRSGHVCAADAVAASFEMLLSAARLQRDRARSACSMALTASNMATCRIVMMRALGGGIMLFLDRDGFGLRIPVDNEYRRGPMLENIVARIADRRTAIRSADMRFLPSA